MLDHRDQKDEIRSLRDQIDRQEITLRSMKVQFTSMLKKFNQRLQACELMNIQSKNEDDFPSIEKDETETADERPQPLRANHYPDWKGMESRK
ncbi:MAG: hypothetical protein OXG88_01185 [Gammaproteobacteria bacterium]|nr:hypothetical protein [Gammaproteobacteria bacterium]